MSDIKIKAGKNWELEVPVAGEPVPTTKFDMGGNSLEESPRFVTLHTPHKAKISLQGAKREDSGELQLVRNMERISLAISITGNGAVSRAIAFFSNSLLTSIHFFLLRWQPTSMAPIVVW